MDERTEMDKCLADIRADAEDTANMFRSWECEIPTDTERVLWLCDQLAASLTRIEALEQDGKRIDFIESSAASVHCNYIAGDEAFTITIDRFSGAEDEYAHGPTVRLAIDAAMAPAAVDPHGERT